MAWIQRLVILFSLEGPDISSYRSKALALKINCNTIWRKAVSVPMREGLAQEWPSVQVIDA